MAYRDDFVDFWGPTAKGSVENTGNFLTGKDPYSEQLPAKNKGQLDYQSQLVQSLSQSHPQIMRFLQQFLGDDEESLNQYSAPFLRQFQTKILPSITERFGGGGSSGRGESGLSSGLMNALGEAGTDLQERLASGRQSMGLQALDKVQGMRSSALESPFGYANHPAQQGLIQSVLSAVAAALAKG